MSNELKANNKTRLIAFIVIGVVIVGFGIFGIGKLLENLNAEEDDDDNSIYPKCDTTLTITDVDGNEFDLADHRDKVVLIYFHFINCGFCPPNGANIKEAMKSYTSEELHVISISIDTVRDTVSTLQQWAEDNNYSWTNALDTDGEFAEEFGVSTTPNNVYISPDGHYMKKGGTQSAFAHKKNIDTMAGFVEEDED